MTLLASDADRVVRDAVDGYLAGRKEYAAGARGETIFETRNSRYRLLDGVLFAAGDTSMLGAEFVGWLLEGLDTCSVQAEWMSGARAILVDPRRGQNIIVTSTTRACQTHATRTQRWAEHESDPDLPQMDAKPRAMPTPAAPPQHPRLPRRGTIPPCPPAPIGRLPGTTEISVATTLVQRKAPPASNPARPLPPPAVPPPRPSAPRVHAPPRPVASRYDSAAAGRKSRSSKSNPDVLAELLPGVSGAGPLPPPIAPPRRTAPSAVGAPPPMPVLPPPALAKQPPPLPPPAGATDDATDPDLPDVRPPDSTTRRISYAALGVEPEQPTSAPASSAPIPLKKPARRAAP
ncbi:MAG TPA: hypothetical protein VGM56_31055 [Byssovorax sp.]|jgi:hypothetical protein